MRVVIFFIFSVFVFQSYGACVTCYSIEDAMEKPEGVRQLILRNKGLSTFPEEILEMKNLTYLDLSFNRIITFPESQGHNTKLTHLLLKRNIGLNSHSLFLYTKDKEQLELIDLTDCQMGQLSFEIGNHKGLKELYLSGNRLSTVPGELGRLSALKTLDLSNNAIVSIPYLLSELYHLESLNIGGNRISNHSGIFLSLSSTNSLKKLTISVEQGSEKISPTIAKLPIHSLHISDSRISVIPPSILRIENLENLVFEQCYFGKKAQERMDWSTLSDSKELAFINCNTLPNMKGLSRTDNVRVFGIDSLPAESLCKMKNVKQLDLSGQSVSSEDISQLEKCLPNTTIIHTSMTADKDMPSSRTPIKEVEALEMTINAGNGQTITTEHMKLTIPSYAFTTENGKPYEGEVTISLKEFYDPVSMMLEQIPMTFSNNGSEELFGSNGMFEFRAFDENNRELSPNPESTITVTLENQQPENPGDLFYFNDNSNEWERAPESNNLRRIDLDSLRNAYLDSLMRLPDSHFYDITVVPIHIHFKANVKSLKPSEFTFIAKKPRKANLIKKKRAFDVSSYVEATNYDQYFITQFNWKIDTTINNDIRKYLRKIRKNQKKLSKKQRRKKWMLINHPRPIRNLTVTPDFERDCFMMSFSYFDTTLTFPVYLASKDASLSIVKEQKQFYEKYQKMKRKEERAQQSINKQTENAIKFYAQQRRRSIAMNLALSEIRNSNVVYDPSFNQNSSLSFSLFSFGLINCDYFQRNPIEEIIDLPKELIAFDGEVVKTPKNVNLLLLNTNSSLNTSYKRIPIQKRSQTLISFPSSDNLSLYVVKLNGPKHSTSNLEVHKINLNGLSTKSIRNQILALAK